MPVYLIDTLKPKNGLDFPVAEAVDVAVEGYSSLADAVTHFATDTAIATIAANLQAQIDQIAQAAGTGTADTEVAQARVGADGTSYQTLKARIDAEISAIRSGDIAENAIRPSKINGYSHFGNIVDLYEKKEIGIYYQYYASTGTIGRNALSTYNSILIPIKPNTHYSTSNYRYMILLSGKRIISENVVGSGESSNGFESGEASFVLLSYSASSESTFAVCEGTTLITDSRYKYDWLITEDEYAREQIEAVKSGGIDDDSIMPLKINGAQVVGNIVPFAVKSESNIYYQYYAANNTIGRNSYSGYNAVLLPIKPNTHYSSDTYRFLILLSSSDIVLSNPTNVVGSGESSNGFDSGNATYALISYLASIENFSVAAGETVIRTTKYSYDWLDVEIPEIESSLKGKTVVNFGDSIAENRTESRSYSVQLHEKVGTINSLNYAVGGATVSEIDGQTMGCILEQVRTCISGHPSSSYSYDIILIDGGANDYSQSREVGSVVKTSNHYSLADYTAEYDTETFLGALEECFKLLRNEYLSAIIVFVIPHKHNRLDDTWQSMVDGMRQACEKWSVACLDIDKYGQLNSRITAMRSLYTDEGGTHQNTLGNEKFYVPQLIRLLEGYFN